MYEQSKIKTKVLKQKKNVTLINLDNKDNKAKSI